MDRYCTIADFLYILNILIDFIYKSFSIVVIDHVRIKNFTNCCNYIFTFIVYLVWFIIALPSQCWAATSARVHSHIFRCIFLLFAVLLLSCLYLCNFSFVTICHCCWRRSRCCCCCCSSVVFFFVRQPLVFVFTSMFFFFLFYSICSFVSCSRITFVRFR